MTYIPEEPAESSLEWQLREYRRIAGEINDRYPIQLRPSKWLLDSSTPPGSEANTGSLLFDPSTNERMQTIIKVPHDFDGITMKIYWSATDATAGNVRWRFRHQVIDGSWGSSTASYTLQEVDSAANGDEVIVEAVLRDSQKIRANTLIALSVVRVATSPNDTYANDARFIHCEAY